MGQTICRKCGIPRNQVNESSLLRHNCRYHEYDLNDICWDCGKQRHIFKHNCRHKWTFKFYCC